MSAQHLSDEAVAAFADGVLRGHARERASRHIAECTECAEAVRGQREAVLALRTAPAPELPCGLLDRLRAVAASGPLPGPAVSNPAPGRFGSFAPMAALLPPAAPARTHPSHPTGPTARPSLSPLDEDAAVRRPWVRRLGRPRISPQD